MPHFRATYGVARPRADVFDVIGTHVYENHPKWEREVVELRPITPGPVGLGSRAKMVREEHGRRSETTYVVTRFEPGRAIAFRHEDGPMDFRLAFELADAKDGGTELTVDVHMSPRGFLRLATPAIALAPPGRTRRITRQMVRVIEGKKESPPTPALLPTHRPRQEEGARRPYSG